MKLKFILLLSWILTRLCSISKLIIFVFLAVTHFLSLNFIEFYENCSTDKPKKMNTLDFIFRKFNLKITVDSLYSNFRLKLLPDIYFCCICSLFIVITENKNAFSRIYFKMLVIFYSYLAYLPAELFLLFLSPLSSWIFIE